MASFNNFIWYEDVMTASSGIYAKFGTSEVFPNYCVFRASLRKSTLASFVGSVEVVMIVVLS